MTIKAILNITRNSQLVTFAIAANKMAPHDSRSSLFPRSSHLFTILYFRILRTTRQKLFHELFRASWPKCWPKYWLKYWPKYWPKYIGYNVGFLVIMADVYAFVVWHSLWQLLDLQFRKISTIFYFDILHRWTTAFLKIFFATILYVNILA